MYCALDSGDNEQNISIGANLRRKTRVNECKETKHSNVASGVGRKQTKIKSASYALYITALVDVMLDVVTIILHVHNLMIG
jgi:hypothetical protein